MPNVIETKVTAETSGAVSSYDAATRAVGGLTGGVRTARTALRDFHGASALVSNVMAGDLMGSLRGASSLMKNLIAGALSPLTVGLTALAAGVIAAGMAWKTYFENQQKARIQARAFADEMQNQTRAARPELFAAGGQAARQVRQMVRRGDNEGANRMLDEVEEKLRAAAEENRRVQGMTPERKAAIEAGKKMQEVGGINRPRQFELLGSQALGSAYLNMAVAIPGDPLQAGRIMAEDRASRNAQTAFDTARGRVSKQERDAAVNWARLEEVQRAIVAELQKFNGEK